MKKSRILESINETVEGLYKAGVMDLKTLREFKELCLYPSSTQKDQQAIASRAD
jgi:hypothetical protein